MTDNALTQARLKEMTTYDAATGVFVWVAGKRAGFVAGCKAKDGYTIIRVDGQNYYAHRLAWLYDNGAWPSVNLDHRDGDRSNNALANLRLATHAENAQNRPVQKNNRSGYLGVSFIRGRYIAQIQSRGKHRVLGYRNTAAEAYELYVAAKAEVHPFQPAPREHANG